MKNSIFQMTAFSEQVNGGNPAGVVLQADSLNERQMLKIANDLGFSETAFVLQSKVADFKIRFFTPTDEVDLCGHATVATFNLLRDLSILKAGVYTQETRAGILKVYVHDQCVFMEQNLPIFDKIINQEELLKCFKAEHFNIVGDLPIQIVSTGLRDILLPIKSKDLLLSLKPQLMAIKKLSRKYNVIGIHAFSLEELNQGRAYVRNFAPLYGINEESATGTANGALASYLKKYFADSVGHSFIFNQGDGMGRPSCIYVDLETKNTEITSLLVGGAATLVGGGIA